MGIIKIIRVIDQQKASKLLRAFFSSLLALNDAAVGLCGYHTRSNNKDDDDGDGDEGTQASQGPHILSTPERICHPLSYRT